MASFSVGSKTVKKIRQGAALGTRETVAHARLRRQPVALQCRWLAKDKATSLGSDFSLGLPVDAPMEAYLSGGRMGHVMVVPGVQFDSVPPKGAHYLQLGQGAASQIISRARLQAAKPSRPDQQMAFGPDDATFVFPIFAERYTDPARFFAAVGELYHWIINVPPFDEQYVRDRFALLGYYWPTDPVVGQCNTRDKEYNCAKPPKQAVVFHGDNETA